MNNNEQLNSKNQISHTDKNNKNKIILNKTNIKVFETNQPVKIEYLSAKKTEIEKKVQVDTKQNLLYIQSIKINF